MKWRQLNNLADQSAPHLLPGCQLSHAFTSQSGLVRAFEPFLSWAARRYQASVARELKKYGLRYEDLLDPIENLVSTAFVGH